MPRTQPSGAIRVADESPRVRVYAAGNVLRRERLIRARRQ